MILEVKNLKKYYPVRRGLFYKTVAWVKALNGVSLSVPEAKTLGLVGESGCGKTTLARAIVRLIEPDEGSVKFLGREISKLPLEQMRSLRKDLQIVFQDPYNSLDPRFKVADIVKEGLLNFTSFNQKSDISFLLGKTLENVGLSQDSLFRYPHEFSGGQRQRISIARSLILNPKLLILDEPVSSLDVSIQSQIIKLLLALQKKLRLSYLFIAHDLNVIRQVSHQVCVMYLGKVMELGPAEELYKHPVHPYTEALLSAVPAMTAREKKKRIILKGEIPSPINPPSGCVFHTRCIYCQQRCRTEVPALEQRDGRFFACHFPLIS